MDGPLAPVVFPHINGVTMHPTAACAPPSVVQCLDHAAAVPQHIGQFFTVRV